MPLKYFIKRHNLYSTPNLGDTYRALKDFKNAEYYLFDGLKRVQKIGDKYWEGVAYKYIGWLYRDKGDKKLAREYLNKALDIFKTINAESGIEDTIFSLASLDIPERVTQAVYGGVEVGSKGVKALAYEIKLGDGELYDLKEIYRGNINTTIISGVKETGRFSPEGIEDTVKAVAELLAELKAKGVPKEQIFLVASSAVSGVSNFDELSAKVKEKTGYILKKLSKDEEVLYSIAGAVPEKYYYTSVVLDIGSGNTKIGYVEKTGEKLTVRSVEIPYGTVTLTEKAKTLNGNFRAALKKVLDGEVKPLLKKEFGRYPAFKGRRDVFLLGGIVWATVSLKKPESVKESYVKISIKDLEGLRKGLSQAPQKVFSPDLGKVPKEDQERAKKEVMKVRDVFSEENLVAGTELLATILDAMGTKDKRLYFSRYGNWLVGYVVLNGYFKESKQ